jgi:hypothetical protein
MKKALGQVLRYVGRWNEDGEGAAPADDAARVTFASLVLAGMK